MNSGPFKLIMAGFISSTKEEKYVEKILLRFVAKTENPFKSKETT